MSTLCSPSTFSSLPLPPSTALLSLSVLPVTNFSATIPSLYRLTQPTISYDNLTFCNLTLTYTHPGQNDYLTVEAWLPEPVNYNSRLQALGGGGWQAGRFDLTYLGMQGALGDGYMTVTTDGGAGYAQTAREWALRSEGNVDLFALNNFASVGLADAAEMAKIVAERYYGQRPAFSYFNGCSQGGRQALMLAQRYPGAYDGIAAGAPAVGWNEVMAAFVLPQAVMAWEGDWPYPCEMKEILRRVTEACDGWDGVVDGVVGEVEECLKGFDLFGLVGEEVDGCEEADGGQGVVVIGETAAKVLDAVWRGRETADGKRMWYGIAPEADVVSLPMGTAVTECTDGVCVGKPVSLGLDWFGLFVAKNSSYDATTATHEEFDRLVYRGKQEFGSMVETFDADLSEFRDLGGKIISWHGLRDNLISAKGPEKYYQSVSALLPGTDNFFRHYEIPGLDHCFGGPSGNPTTMFDQLRAWVENGTAPESMPIQVTALGGEVHDRIICPYPARARYVASCGDPASAECWACQEIDRPVL